MPEGDSTLELHNIEGEVTGVSLLASATELEWELNGDKLSVKTPSADNMDAVANVFKISVVKK